MLKYIGSLSGSDMDIFEELISNKFKKFRHFYRLVEDVSEKIDKLHYNFTSSSSLEVSIELHDGEKPKEVAKYLQDKTNDKTNYECNIVIKKEELKITITLEE